MEKIIVTETGKPLEDARGRWDGWAIFSRASHPVGPRNLSEIMNPEELAPGS